jgi:hypothetical protein
MKISEIKELDADGYPISSVSLCTVKKVGEIKNGSQLNVIEDDGVSIGLSVKSHALLFQSGDVGKSIEIVSGKPIKGVPQGITLKIVNDKKRISIGSGATVKFSSSELEEQEEPQLTEQTEPLHESSDGPIQLTQPEGPSDKLIRECFHERLHILNILQQENKLNGSPFSLEALFPMVTSISIDAIRAGKSILPPKQPTKKYDIAPKKNSLPLPDDNSDKMTPDLNINNVIQQYNGIFAGVTDTAGNPITDAIRDYKKRGKLMRWFFRDGDSGKLPKVAECCRKLTKIASVKVQLRNESIMYDLADKAGIEYCYENEERLEGMMTADPATYWSK